MDRVCLPDAPGQGIPLGSNITGAIQMLLFMLLY